MTPDFRIEADADDVTAAIRDRLLSLRITDEDGVKADRLEMALDDRDGRIAFPATDTVLTVSLGFRGAPLALMGRYAVDGVSGEGPTRRMTVAAHAADMKTEIRAAQTRAWEGKSLADIVKVIASEAGLDPVVAASIAGVRWPYLAQTAESNLHFLTRIARTLDATAKPAGGKLLVAKRGEGKTAAGDDTTPVEVDVRRLGHWTWRRETRGDNGTVTAEWSDTLAGAVRKITRGTGDPKKALRHIYPSEDEAVRACEAELDGSNRGGWSIDADLAGFEPALFAGGRVRFTGLRPELGGDWHIKTVTHELGSGLTTSVAAEKTPDKPAEKKDA